MRISLEDIWRDQAGRFTPEQEPLSPAELLGALIDKIADLAGKLLKYLDFEPVITAAHVKRALFITSALLLMLLLCYIYRRRHLLFSLRGKVFSGVKEEPPAGRYAHYLARGDFAAALRFLVLLASEYSRGTARTFREIFGSAPDAEKEDAAATYGGMMHRGDSIDRSGLDRCENLLSGSYPVLYRRIRGRRQK